MGKDLSDAAAALAEIGIDTAKGRRCLDVLALMLDDWSFDDETPDDRARDRDST
jgi:hypothetical protein